MGSISYLRFFESHSKFKNELNDKYLSIFLDIFMKTKLIIKPILINSDCRIESKYHNKI